MKLAVITGGTKGIGKALVERFAKEGFAIVTCSRHAEDLQHLQQAIVQQYQVPCYVRKTDLAQKEEVKAFGEFVLDLSLPVQVLINNAGAYTAGKFWEEDETQFERLLQTNVASVYHLTRLLAPSMISRQEGHIFNICSVLSQIVRPEATTYCTSKFALYGMTKAMREDLKPFKVRVTAVLPSTTLTESWAGTDIPPERFVKPEDIAHTVWGAYALSAHSVLEEVVIRPQLGDL